MLSWDDDVQATPQAAPQPALQPAASAATADQQGVLPSSATQPGILGNNPNAAEQSPDGLPNYLLRSVPTIVAGVNSSNALDATKVTGITRGSGNMYFLDPNQPTARAHEWSFLVERELFTNTVMKLGYVGTHGARMSQWYSFNNNPPDYVWFAGTGLHIVEYTPA